MRRAETFAAVVLLLLLALFVADHDAWLPDEPRVVGLDQSVARGSWVVPRLDGTPFLEQPPLHAWAVAGAFRAFGETVTVARIVSALFGALSLVVTFLYGRELGGRRVGAFAALSLGLSFEFFNTSHRIIADTALGACVVGSAYASLRGLMATGRPRFSWLSLAYALASLAYLAKGAIGIALSGLAFLAVVAARREPRAFLTAHLWAAPIIFAAITGPWHLALAAELGPGAVREVAFGQVLLRAMGTGGPVAPHEQPWWFYLALLVPALLPAGLFFVAGLVRYALERKKLPAAERFAHEVGFFWLGAGVFILSVVDSKRPVYLVPLFPAAAVIAAFTVEAALTGAIPARLVRFLALVLSACLGAGAIALVVAALVLDLGLARAAAGAVAIALAAALAFRAAWGARLEAAFAVLTASLVVVLGAVCVSIVPFLDAQKGQSAFFAEVGRRVPSDQAVCAIYPDESTRGGFPFATNRSLLWLDGRAGLVRRIEALGEVWLLVIEKNEKNPLTPTLADLHPETVMSDDRPMARSLRLLRFKRR